MKFPTLKRAWLASLYQYLLCLAMALALGIGASFAEESSAPYQSTFEDYKATNSDNQTDWKSLDSSIADQGLDYPRFDRHRYSLIKLNGVDDGKGTICRRI